jgi:prevent-host-death family protein
VDNVRRIVITATDAKNNLGPVIDEVAIQGKEIFIERLGRPIVVVLSVAQYQEITGRRAPSETPTEWPPEGYQRRAKKPARKKKKAAKA